MPTGTAVLDFGAFPGASDASVVVTGQTFIGAASRVEAWLRLQDSADHSADEHLVETIKVAAGNIVPGVGFTIYGINTNQLNEPLTSPGGPANTVSIAPKAQGITPSVGGRGTLIYGQWIVDWVWV